jgi:hypothetical protein
MRKNNALLFHKKAFYFFSNRGERDTINGVYVKNNAFNSVRHSLSPLFHNETLSFLPNRGEHGRRNGVYIK